MSAGAEAVGEESAEVGGVDFDVLLRLASELGDEGHLGVEHEESCIELQARLAALVMSSSGLQVSAMPRIAVSRTA